MQAKPQPLDLLNRVACLLAGKNVSVRLRHPSIIGAAGACYERPGGAHIDLNPDKPPPELLTNFLHEVGHAKLHQSGRAALPHEAIDQPPSTVEIDQKYLESAYYKAIERQAKEQSTVWQTWAEKYAVYYGAPDDSPEVKKLLALKDYGNKDAVFLRILVTEGSKRGAALAIKKWKGKV